MFTQKEFKQLEVFLRKAIRKGYKDQHDDLQAIVKRLDNLETSIVNNQEKSLNEIIEKLDKLKPVLKLLGARQRILEKKMRAIEDYFDHRN